MACKDCQTGCEKIIPDHCVQYTGEDIPLLGICTGDFLSDVQEIILDRLQKSIDGTGIDLSDLTLDCPYTTTLLNGSDKTLANLIQKLFDSQCTLKGLIDTLNGQVNVTYAFNTSCLTLPTNPTKDDILQAAITKLCSIDSRLVTVENNYVKNSDLATLVNNIINPTNTSTVIQYGSRMVPYAVMAYFGSLSNFDNTGKGIASVGYDKIYICNGANGTPDLRGRTIVGAVRNIPGGSLDAAVDPMNPLNPNTNYSINDKFGENYHKLSILEMPSHSHSVNDPGHGHDVNGQRGGDDDNHNNTTRFAGGDKGVNETGFNFTNSTAVHDSTTGITVNASGSGSAHENRQPSMAGAWIIYIP